MVDLVTELSRRAQELAPEDRARLAEELLASLDPHVAEVEAAWSLEIGQRIREIEDGTVAPVPSETAFAQIRQSLRR